jgi:hypothetical protein
MANDDPPAHPISHPGHYPKDSDKKAESSKAALRRAVPEYIAGVVRRPGRRAQVPHFILTLLKVHGYTSSALDGPATQPRCWIRNGREFQRNLPATCMDRVAPTAGRLQQGPTAAHPAFCQVLFGPLRLALLLLGVGELLDPVRVRTLVVGLGAPCLSIVEL